MLGAAVGFLLLLHIRNIGLVAGMVTLLLWRMWRERAGVRTVSAFIAPIAAFAASALAYVRDTSSMAGAISSQPAAQRRMNGLRRCAYWRSSSAQTMAAAKAATRSGLIGIAVATTRPSASAPWPPHGAERGYTSSSSASSARSMMNRKRAEASLPISSLMTRSVTI